MNTGAAMPRPGPDAVTDPTHYEILGVAEDATPDQIQAAWRARRSAAHPDNGGDPEDAKRLNQAYTILIDPDQRAEYDQTLPSRAYHALLQGLYTKHMHSVVKERVAAALEDCLPTLFTTRLPTVAVVYHRMLDDLNDGLREARAAVRTNNLSIKELRAAKGAIARRKNDQGNMFDTLLDEEIAHALEVNKRTEDSIRSFEQAMEMLLREYQVQEAPTTREKGAHAWLT